MAQLMGCHDDAKLLAPPLHLVAHRFVGEPVTHNRYMEVMARMEKAKPDQRNARVAAMLETLRAAVDLLGDYEELTGIHSHSGPLRRAVQPMIEMLERNRVDKEEA